MFVCAGGAMWSSLAGHLHALVTRSPRPGLGMSGILMALLALQAVAAPDSRFQIIFLPFFTFSAIHVCALALAMFPHSSHSLSYTPAHHSRASGQ